MRTKRPTREWRRARTKASPSKLPTSAFALGRRTRRKARRPFSRSAHRSSTGAEAHGPQESQEKPMATDNIFSGLKVVDFSSFVAGPGAAVILSDFGADVIKVEPPSGDAWRIGNHLPPYPQAKEPYQWHLANRNKRGITLDLKSPGAQQILER